MNSTTRDHIAEARTLFAAAARDTRNTSTVRLACLSAEQALTPTGAAAHRPRSRRPAVVGPSGDTGIRRALAILAALIPAEFAEPAVRSAARAGRAALREPGPQRERAEARP